MTKKRTAIAAILAALALAVSGCGGDDSETDTHIAANGDEFNDADVTFATDMIPHHAQALSMVDLTMDRRLDPAVQQLTDDIRAAQTPEIEQMSGWLMDWDKPIPETMRDHAHGDMDSGSMDMDSDMPGVMSSEEMHELDKAHGAEFQTMWLKMMVEHHEGAIEMAETEQDDGTFQPAIDLANSIEKSQQAEIDEMESLLDS